MTLTTPGVAADSNGVSTRSANTPKRPSASMGSPSQTSRAGFFRTRSPPARLKKCGRSKAPLRPSLADKTSLVVEATHALGLRCRKVQRTPFRWATDRTETPTAGLTFASGSRTFGNFVALDGVAVHRSWMRRNFQPSPRTWQC